MSSLSTAAPWLFISPMRLEHESYKTVQAAQFMMSMRPAATEDAAIAFFRPVASPPPPPPFDTAPSLELPEVFGMKLFVAEPIS